MQAILHAERFSFLFFFFIDTATTYIYTLSLHDALPILSTECLIQLTKLGYDATPFNQILKQNAKREMRLRLGKVTVADVLAAQPDDKSAQIYARFDKNDWRKIGRAVQQECRDRSRMPSS